MPQVLGLKGGSEEYVETYREWMGARKEKTGKAETKETTISRCRP